MSARRILRPQYELGGADVSVNENCSFIYGLSSVAVPDGAGFKELVAQPWISSGSSSRVLTTKGPAVNFGGSNYFYSALPLQPPVSQLYVLVHGSNAVIGGSGIGSSSSANRTQWDTYGTSGRFRAISVDNVGGVVSAESGITPAAASICSVIFTAAANGSVQVFFGGAKASSTASTSFGAFSKSYIGAIAFDPPNNFYAAPILLSASWGRVLSDSEAYAILDRPAQLVRKASRNVYFLPSAGGGATITPTGLSSSAFGSFSVLAGDRTITFTGKASDEAFGSFSLRAKRLVSFTGKSSDEAFGAFSVHPGSVSILLNSKTTDEAYGTHSLLSGQKVISPTAKGSDSAFGSFIIVSGDRILLINGIASNEAFGAFSVNNNTANQTIIPSGYFDSSIGSFSLRPDQYIIFSGKEYLEFGQFLLSGSAVVRAMHFFDWIAQQPGLRGTLNDKLYQYLIAQGFTGSTPTMMFLWLRSLGYTGNTASMLTAFERDYTTRWY